MLNIYLQDVLISFKNTIINNEKLELHLKINNNLDLEILLLELTKFKDFKYDYQINQNHNHLIFYKGISSKKVEEIAYNINSEIDELLSDSPLWESGFNGILQLVQIACVQSKLTYE